MRNTTKAALGIAAAVAATLAMGVGSASALQWSSTGVAKLEGTLALKLGNTSRTATCANLTLNPMLSNPASTGPQWSIQGTTIVNCVDDQTGQARQMPVYFWSGWAIQSGSSLQLHGGQYSTGTYTYGPFSNVLFRNTNDALYFDLINGNQTTPTKVVLNDDIIGRGDSIGQGVNLPIRATGELTLRHAFAGFPGYTGPTLITLNP